MNLNRLVLGFAAVALVSCHASAPGAGRTTASASTAANAPTAASAPAASAKPVASSAKPGPDDGPLWIARLPYENPETRQRIVDLATCIDGLREPDQHWGLWKPEGQSLMGRWCSGKGARSNCMTDDNARDQHAITLFTLHWTERDIYYGVGLNAAWVPPAGWAARFSLDDGGKTLVGDSFGLAFWREPAPPKDYGAANTVEPLYFGDSYGYKVFGQEKYLGGLGEAPRVAAARYLGSAEALRKGGLDLLARARAGLLELFARHEPKVGVEGPYLGHGVPPEITYRDATAAEEASEKAKAMAHFDAQEALLRDHYQEMYAALVRAFPVDRCWR
jgi:hypothetical protein